MSKCHEKELDKGISLAIRERFSKSPLVRRRHFLICWKTTLCNHAHWRHQIKVLEKCYLYLNWVFAILGFNYLSKTAFFGISIGLPVQFIITRIAIFTPIITSIEFININ